MNSVVRLSAFITCCLVCGLAPGDVSKPTVLILGDSLSAGYGIDLDQAWPDLLAKRLSRAGYPHVIINASISGETTRGGLARLERLIGAHRPVVGVIALGANDGLRGISLDEIRRNLLRMIAMLQDAGAEPLVVRMRLPPNYGATYADRFEALYDGLFPLTGVALAPFLLQGVALKPDLMQEDGLHPNASAQPIMVDNIWPALEPLLRGQ